MVFLADQTYTAKDMIDNLSEDTEVGRQWVSDLLARKAKAPHGTTR